MNGNASEEMLSSLSDLIAEKIGLRFPPERWQELEKKMNAVAREFGVADNAALTRQLISSSLTQAQIEILASHLTVGETYFFRETQLFEILERHVLPELIRTRQGSERRLRIWSAGCCSGEEPYSIAISLHKAIPNIKEWDVTLLATDINPQFLRKAAEGVYGEWSFRGVPTWIKERYFRPTKDGRFEISSSIKERVTFSYLNLVEDAYPSLLNNTNGMDVIFCRNVLMYFSQPHVKKVARNFRRALVEGGWLIVSPTESMQILSSPFAAVNFPDATLYRKESHAARSEKRPDVFYPPPQTVTPPPEPIPSLPASPPPARNEPPPNPYLEAQVLYERGLYIEVVEKLVGQKSVEAFTLMARAFANQGKLAEAKTWCDKAIAAKKLDAGLHYLLATILLEQNQPDAASASLKRSLYLEPKFALAHFALGHLALRQGKNKEASKHLHNALAVLNAHSLEDMLPHSEGITAGRLAEVIRSTLQQGETP